MATYNITYDLNNETTRPPILKDIKAYDGWAKLSESSYAIITTETPQQVYNKLKKHLDSDDQLYVISIKKPYAGQGDPEVNEWLDSNLTG